MADAINTSIEAMPRKVVKDHLIFEGAQYKASFAYEVRERSPNSTKVLGTVMLDPSVYPEATYLESSTTNVYWTSGMVSSLLEFLEDCNKSLNIPK